MEVAEVGASGRKKVTQSLLGKAKQIFIPQHIICFLCMCCDNLIFHGVKENQLLVIGCGEPVNMLDSNNIVVFMSIFPRFVTKNHTLC